MSRATAAIAALEGVGDRMNAILVKEVRQALKSRQFVGAFMLMLLAAWGGTILGLAFQGPSLEFGSPAQIFFGGFFFVLCAATLIVVPFSAYRSFIEERSEHTLDLVQITGLTPRRIVAGKLLSALVQSLVFYSAIAPFIAFTSLLQGFNFVSSSFSLVLLLLVSQFYSMVALAIGATAKTKSAMSFTSITVVILCLIGFSTFWGMATGLADEVDFASSDFWWLTGFGLFGLLSTTFLCLQVSVAQLTFDSDNRSTGIRLTVAAQFILFWVGMFLAQRYSGMGTMGKDEWEVLATMTTFYVGAAGMFFCSEYRAADGLARHHGRTMIPPVVEVRDSGVSENREDDHDR